MASEMTTLDRNDQLPAVQLETASTVLAAQAKALVEARFKMAMYNPRNEDEVRQRLLKECKRTSFASVAIFSKPVGGKKIEGLSIRFAEGALRCMKNIDIQAPTIYDDRAKRIIRVSVTELESNLCYSLDITIEKTVERSQLKEGQQAISSRLNSAGKVVHLVDATDDELLVKQGALISKAIRTQGLRVIPGDLLDECKSVIKATMAAADYQDPDAAKRKLFDSFDEIGVTAAQLQTWLGHEGKVLNPQELQELRAIFVSIRDSETTWRAIMELKDDGKKPPATKPKNLKEAMGNKNAPAASSAPADEPSLAKRVHDALSAAQTSDELDAAWEMIGPEDALPKDEQAALGALYTKRSKELEG